MASSSPIYDLQAEAEVGERYPLVPDDAVYVEVKIEVKESGDLFHFYARGQHYVKEYSDWVESIVNVDSKYYDCVLYTGKTSGKHF
jgi:hypothetical protein